MVVDNIVDQLKRFPSRGIQAFDRLLQRRLAEANRHDLWAVAYIVRNGCSDDEFEYFCAWLVLQGRQRFEAALAEPQAVGEFLGIDDPQAEQLLNAAQIAYETSTRKRWTPNDTGRTETRGSSWREEDLPTMYPALWDRFGTHHEHDGEPRSP